MREVGLSGLLRSKNSQNCMHGLMREGCSKAVFFSTGGSHQKLKKKPPHPESRRGWLFYAKEAGRRCAGMSNLWPDPVVLKLRTDPEML